MEDIVRTNVADAVGLPEQAKTRAFPQRTLVSIWMSFRFSSRRRRSQRLRRRLGSLIDFTCSLRLADILFLVAQTGVNSSSTE